MSQVSDILTFARTQSKTDSNGLTDANGLVFVNEALLDFHRKLIARGVDASQLQEAYRDGAVNTGTYLYPSDMFFLKSIELNYSDTNPQEYRRAEQVDVSNLEANVSVGWLRQNASKQSPQFDDRGDWYEIFPTPTSSDNVSQLIRIFYFLKPNDYSGTTDNLAYPETLDYRILGWRVAASYLYSLETAVGQTKGDKYVQVYEAKVQELIGLLSRGTQQPTQVKRLIINGWEF